MDDCDGLGVLNGCDGGSRNRTVDLGLEPGEGGVVEGGDTRRLENEKVLWEVDVVDGDT